MKRRDFITHTSMAAGAFILPWEELLAAGPELLNASVFGKDFIWGTATAAYQIEGAHNVAGKGMSIWDKFSHTKGKIKTGENGDQACDFYRQYPADIMTMNHLGFRHFRFSLSWSRLFPTGTGSPNAAGVAFYHRVIDECLDKGVTPWVTLYHWDLPQALEDKGGWTSRDILQWFTDYVDFCTKEYGGKVKNWMVFNEPTAFTFLGYFLGIHAPGKKGFKNLMSAIHHVALCQAIGGRIAKKNVENGNIGTTYSCSYVEPKTYSKKDIAAANRIHALTNRLFIEPVLGYGYPYDGWKAFHRLDKYIRPGDMEMMKFDFDFIGLQNYFRIVAEHSLWPPVMWGKQVKPEKLTDADHLTLMGWEVYPDGMYNILKVFNQYDTVKKWYITENGAAFADHFEGASIHDVKRQEYFIGYLKSVLKIKNEGMNLQGYFIWSFMDNFEWAEGFHPRFGLVHVDFETQKRTIKDSGYWWRDFLKR